jgi:hypothetical protein
MLTNLVVLWASLSAVFVASLAIMAGQPIPRTDSGRTERPVGPEIDDPPSKFRAGFVTGFEGAALPRCWRAIGRAADAAVLLS